MAEAVQGKSRGLKFAEQQLLRHGWEQGKGLGREENGISEAIKVKVKCDKGGVGHREGEQFTFHWWDHVFNKAASSLGVESDQNGVQVKKLVEEEDDDDRMISNKKPRKASLAKAKLYGCFVKSATLLSGQELPEQKSSSSDDSSSDDEDQRLDLSSTTKLSDADLMKACGGRTAHKGARHGLTMSAKLARLEQQEQEFMAKYSKKSQSAEASLESVITNNQLAQTPEVETVEEIRSKKSKKKKKRRKHDDAEEKTSKESADVVVSESPDNVITLKKKKRRSKQGGEVLMEVPMLVEQPTAEVNEVDHTKKKRRKKRKMMDEDSSRLNGEACETTGALQQKETEASTREDTGDIITQHQTLTDPIIKQKKKSSKSKREKTVIQDNDTETVDVIPKKKKRNGAIELEREEYVTVEEEPKLKRNNIAWKEGKQTLEDKEQDGTTILKKKKKKSHPHGEGAAGL